MNFKHTALDLIEDKKIVFTALSKHYFFFRMHICKFVFEQNCVPVNPFMIFDYFLLDTVNRDLIRNGNNNLLKRADELWVFGDISNGVLAEIKIAQSLNMPIKYFKIENYLSILQISKEELKFEDEVKDFQNEIVL